MRFGSGQLPGTGELANEEGLYVSPDGERGWAILEREDEDVLRGTHVLATRRMRVPEVAEVAGPLLHRVGLG